MASPVLCSTWETRFTDAEGRRCDGAPSSEAAYSSLSLLLGYPHCTEHLTPEDVEEGLDDRLNYPHRLDAGAATFVFVNLQHLLPSGAPPTNPAAAAAAVLRRPKIDAQLLRRASLMQLAAVVAPGGTASPLQEGDVADAQKFPACLWEARDGQPPAKTALCSFAEWLMHHHEHRARGANAPASDIVLLLHYVPYHAPLLAAALEREGARLPPVRIADSCLLAKYALSEVEAAKIGAASASGSGDLRHPAGLKALVESHCPQWLRRAPWYRPLESSLSNARCALVATAALSRAAWGADDAWRAFALGMSAPAADVFGRAGYPLAATLASRPVPFAHDGTGGGSGVDGGGGRGGRGDGGDGRGGGTARGRRGGRGGRGSRGRGRSAAAHSGGSGAQPDGGRATSSRGRGGRPRGGGREGRGRRGGRAASGRGGRTVPTADAASLLSPLTTRAGRRRRQEAVQPPTGQQQPGQQPAGQQQPGQEHEPEPRRRRRAT
ncbi:hypothetical protein Rsub_11150 [Raphidocelis subcapitata]|uniref:Uncharacterized protein n=1 Tax=Raphidocelis subcapitata TaxID=307507 RepID=A0A2V0PFW4_9CHLO|nr:hypothetical protein Rsub_11150 [Raphidocelis subcapitata]|eukprot:GBF98744.1 hypothetical protein Rsub_11150 [Raphidocelis subcapitata]